MDNMENSENENLNQNENSMNENDNNDNNGGENDGSNIVKLRGLPWNSTAADIVEFLGACEIVNGEKGVHLAISHRDGRPNGEAYVELASANDVEKAFTYNRNTLGHRYIEIFNAKSEDFEQCMKRQNLVQQDTFVKLRGLPFSCKVEDVETFFQGLEIRNGTNGIHIVNDNRGRPTGEAFVQFCNTEDVDLAMKKNREKIGHRYIEIFRSSSSEHRRSSLFNGGRNMGGGGGGFGFGFGNDRGGRGGGPGGMRNNRSNFRDRPYDTPWNQGNNDAPWRNRNSFGGGFGGGNNNGNMFNSNFNDFERNWNSGGNSYNSFGGGNNGFGGGGGGNNNSKGGNNLPSFDRDFSFNNFNNNSNGNGGGFGNNNFGGSGGGMNNGPSQYAVHLRGMPYDCGETDVQEFFAPLKLAGVEVFYNNNGRHTGEADAFFENIADAQEAMKRHKEKMGSRYIELFAKSNDRRGGGGGGGRF